MHLIEFPSLLVSFTKNGDSKCYDYVVIQIINDIATVIIKTSPPDSVGRVG